MAAKSILKSIDQAAKSREGNSGVVTKPTGSCGRCLIPTIKRLEAQEGLFGGRDETGTKIRMALEAAGIEFIDENGGGPGVRLRKRQPK